MLNMMNFENIMPNEKSVTKGHLLSDSIYMTYLEKANLRDRRLGLPEVRELWGRGEWKVPANGTKQAPRG